MFAIFQPFLEGGFQLGVNLGTFSSDRSQISFAAAELAVNASYTFSLRVQNSANVSSAAVTATVQKLVSLRTYPFEL